jgi:hypothetical protein
MFLGILLMKPPPPPLAEVSPLEYYILLETSLLITSPLERVGERC